MLGVSSTRLSRPSRASMAFFLLWLATTWKYVVCLSPSLTSLSLDLYLALISSILQIFTNSSKVFSISSFSTKLMEPFSYFLSSRSYFSLSFCFSFLISASTFLAYPLNFFLSNLTLNCQTSIGLSRQQGVSQNFLMSSGKSD